MKAIIKYIRYFFALVVLLNISCDSEDDGTTKISFWAMGQEGEYISKLIPKFESQNPGIKIKVQKIPWSLAHEKLLTAFAGQSTPDICQLGNTWIAEFQAIDALFPLDSLLKSSDTVIKEKFFPGIWNTNVIGKHVFGIPWYVDTHLLFYRKDILASVGYDHPPKTWEEWLDVSRKIKQNNQGKDKKYADFFSLVYNDWAVPVIFIFANNGRLLKQNATYGAFDEPKTREALRFYIRFFQENLAPKNITQVSNIYQGFSNGFFSMFVTGPWNISAIRRRTPELNGRWSTAPLPARITQDSIAGGSSLVIFDSARDKKNAWKFIEYLSMAETQIEFFRLTQNLPAVYQAWHAREIRNDREILAFYHQLKHVRPTPKIAEWEQIAVKIQEHCEQVIYGKKTLDQAVQDLNKDVDRILEKRRWLISKNFIDLSD